MTRRLARSLAFTTFAATFLPLAPLAAASEGATGASLTSESAVGVSVVREKDPARDVVREAAWRDVSAATRRAVDLRRATVGDSPRGAEYLRFTWRTRVLEGPQRRLGRTYVVAASTPGTGTSVEVLVSQSPRADPVPALLVDGKSRGCIRRPDAAPVAFDVASRTVSLDVPTTCMSSATDDAVGLVLSHAGVDAIELGRRFEPVGYDSARFRFGPQINF